MNATTSSDITSVLLTLATQVPLAVLVYIMLDRKDRQWWTILEKMVAQTSRQNQLYEEIIQSLKAIEDCVKR